MKKRMLVLSMLLGSCMCSAAGGQHDDMTIGRYVTVKVAPSSAQKEVLSHIFQVHFPHTIQTVGDAIQYLLRYSGYSLVAESQQSAALQTTLKKPLPLIHRSLGPLTLHDGLIVLVGPAFLLHSDPLTRDINFTVKPGYLKRHR